MNTLFTTAIAFLLIGFQSSNVYSQKTTAEENDQSFLLEYYQQNINQLRAKTTRLSEAQLAYQPSPESWSVSMCLEHIYLTEKSLAESVQALFEQPVNPQDRELLAASDEDIMNNLVDRSAKFKAPEVLHPTGEFKTAEQALEAIIDNRAKIFQLIDAHSVEEMRNRVADAPFGKMDGYQYILFIAAHAERHRLQIDEVIASEGFPAK
ncbi:DinB family protein [Planktosalinus lacus]|uniref:DinB-like domain-containing protein n=1 Tax=Planktosalinus lacus TaxID=1526573 RepID=A0A8J2V8J0_9FLAO|nr:DinB family protein [Planktosalinus lacus]GGD84271.1 hypothetical protein GCM10011312_05360 [Planktosalinus lacus]